MNKGFTLIEIIITIAIVAVVGVPLGTSINDNLQKEKEKEIVNFYEKVASAATLFVKENNTYYAKLVNEKQEDGLLLPITILINNGLLSKNIVDPEDNVKITSITDIRKKCVKLKVEEEVNNTNKYILKAIYPVENMTSIEEEICTNGSDILSFNDAPEISSFKVESLNASYHTSNVKISARVNDLVNNKVEVCILRSGEAHSSCVFKEVNSNQEVVIESSYSTGLNYEENTPKTVTFTLYARNIVSKAESDPRSSNQYEVYTYCTDKTNTELSNCRDYANSCAANTTATCDSTSKDAHFTSHLCTTTATNAQVTCFTREVETGNCVNDFSFRTVNLVSTCDNKVCSGPHQTSTLCNGYRLSCAQYTDLMYELLPDPNRNFNCYIYDVPEYPSPAVCVAYSNKPPTHFGIGSKFHCNSDGSGCTNQVININTETGFIPLAWVYYECYPLRAEEI